VIVSGKYAHCDQQAEDAAATDDSGIFYIITLACVVDELLSKLQKNSQRH